jgi:hypothetical protein
VQGSVFTPALAGRVSVGSIGALGLAAAELDEVRAGMTARTTAVLAANFLTADIDCAAVEAVWSAAEPPPASSKYSAGRALLRFVRPSILEVCT